MNKLIAVRVDIELYRQIKELAVFTNNTVSGYCEGILIHTIPQRNKLIPADKVAEIRRKLEEK
jgi:hypothetical protein